MRELLLLSLALGVLAKDCQTNSDCFATYESCPSGGGECEHKNVFSMEWDQFCGTFLVAVGIGLCNAAGIGGGPVMLPLIVLFHHFRQTEAVALATFLIFMGALVRFIRNFKQRHPTKPFRVSIDYNIILVLMPMSLFGTTLGVLINSTFPDPAIMVMQCIVFTAAAFFVFKKGCQLAKKERQERAEKRRISAKQSNTTLKSYKAVANGKGGEPGQQGQIESHPEGEINPSQLDVDQAAPSDRDKQPSEVEENSDILKSEDQQILARIKRREGSHCPCVKICIIWTIVGSLVLISILRGAKGDSIVGIQRCSAGDWGLQATLLLVCILALLTTIIILSREDKLKRKVGYEYDQTDLKLNAKNVLKLAGFSLIGSTIAIAVGVGGSIIFNPLLLSLGISPTVSSATALYLVMFNTFVSSVQFIIIGTLNWQFAGFLSIFIVIGTLTGLSVISAYVKRTGKQSVIVLLLGCVICVGIILTPTITLLRLQDEENIWSFSALC